MYSINYSRGEYKSTSKYAHVTILPQNVLRRDCNDERIELIEGHYLEVVVEVYLEDLTSHKCD